MWAGHVDFGLSFFVYFILFFCIFLSTHHERPIRTPKSSWSWSHDTHLEEQISSNWVQAFLLFNPFSQLPRRKKEHGIRMAG